MNDTAKLLLLAVGVLPWAVGCPQRYVQTPNSPDVNPPVRAERAIDRDGAVTVEADRDPDSIQVEQRDADAGGNRVDVEVE